MPLPASARCRRTAFGSACKGGKSPPGPLAQHGIRLDRLAENAQLEIASIHHGKLRQNAGLLHRLLCRRPWQHLKRHDALPLRQGTGHLHRIRSVIAVHLVGMLDEGIHQRTGNMTKTGPITFSSNLLENS
jgi:hypothetical protein